MPAPRSTPNDRARPTPGPGITILGIGQMGLVCAAMLSESERSVKNQARPRARITLWGHQPAEVAMLAQTRRSERLPGVVLPEGVRVESSIQQALAGASLIVSAIPVQPMREAWQDLAAWVPAPTPSTTPASRPTWTPWSARPASAWPI